MRQRISRTPLGLVISLLVVAALLALALPRAAAVSASTRPISTAPPQAQNSGVPGQLAQGAQPLEQVAQVTMPGVDAEALRAEDVQRAAQGLPTRFAQPIPVQISPDSHGSWETLADGSRLWRLRIATQKALSINLGFSTYWMPASGKLFLYSPDYRIVRGPFGQGDNESHGEFWSPILTDDELVIELQVSAAEAADVRLQLSSVNHGYAEFGRARPELLSGACNLDVICGTADGFPQVEPWRDEIRSVAVISTGGTTFCTGFLVNNTAQDLRGFFMTANHCGIGVGNAPSLVTYWNFENSTCRQPDSPESGQPGDGTLDQFNTGSIFRSSGSASDFTLVELDDPIDPTYNVHWAGWDARVGDYASAIAIHHPNTDEKRISFENDATTTTSYLGTAVPGDGTHVRVADWDLGTTEPGSSGSPLFSPEGRVVGQLHGGFAACGNDDADWYGRFNVSWTGGGTDSTRLSNWLDPVGGGTILVLDGRDAMADFNLEATPDSQAICTGETAAYEVIATATNNYTATVTLSASGTPAGTSATFTPNPITVPATSTLEIGNTAGATAGDYTIDIVGVGPTTTHTTTVGLTLSESAPTTVTLQTPPDGATDVALNPSLGWTPAAGATSYLVEVATDPGFTNIVASESASTNLYDLATTLDAATTYYWRVTPGNPCGDGTVSEVFSFTTANVLCVQPGAAIPDNNPAGVRSTFPVGNSGSLTDLDVYLDVTHTWVGDLIFTLEHNGTTVTMIDRPGRTTSGFGCQGDNIDHDVDDEGDTVAETECTDTTPAYPVGARLIPNEPLSAFDGMELSGDWVLTVSDAAGGDTGTLNAWCLIPAVDAPTAVTVADLASAPRPLPLLAIGMAGMTLALGGLWLRRSRG